MDSERASLHKARALEVYAMPPRHAAKSPPNVLAYMLPSFAIHSCLMTKLQVKWSVEVFKCFGLRSFRLGYFPDTEEVRSSNLLTPTKCSQLRGYVFWAVLFCHQARRQISRQILIQGLYAMVFASRRGAGRLHTSWPIVTATCWSSIIFWILLA